MKHRVHLYVTTRVVLEDIEADSHEAALDIAMKRFHSESERLTKTGEYADEVTAALVDEENDPEYERSTNHDFNVYIRQNR